MKILSASQIREADHYTIQNESISSSDLMERASKVFVEWFEEKISEEEFSVTGLKIFCGTGNNGGDGLCIARMLSQSKFSIEVFILRTNSPTKDFELNENRLKEITSVKIQSIGHENDFPSIEKNHPVIDALFGSGLNRPIEGLATKLIDHINHSNADVIAVDIPSGLFADKVSSGAMIKARHTLTFELPKFSFMFPTVYEYAGEWETKSIGLSKDFIEKSETKNFYFTDEDAKEIFKPGKKFDHKGSNGHALIVAGSKGKMGAAFLAAKAAFKTGCGLVTIHVPKGGVDVIHEMLPEAMIQIDENENFMTSVSAVEKFSSIGIGPGLGEDDQTAKAIQQFNSELTIPLVLDADALNLIAKHKLSIPKNSILTPHPKEFERLFGKVENDFERNELQRKKAIELQCFIVLKGAHTCTATPEGECYFNSSGNPGMAKAGSGDVLTGMITSLLAQGYSAKDAAVFGVYLHGLAGDFASEIVGTESMMASDIIENIQTAYDYLKVI